jgi:hypothetical protein
LTFLLSSNQFASVDNLRTILLPHGKWSA